MASPVLDKDALLRRLQRVYDAWKDPTEETSGLKNVDCIVIAAGTSEEDDFYSKTQSVHRWLFGYQLTDVIIVLGENNIRLLGSKKKMDFLKSIEDKENSSNNSKFRLPPINLLQRDKTDKDKANYEKLVEVIRASGNGKIIGEFVKDRYDNEFITDFRAMLKDFEFNDVSAAFASIMAEKEETEIEMIKKACTVTTEVFQRYFKEEVTEIIDSDKKVKHFKLSENIEKAFNEKKFCKNLNPSQIEACYPPIVQSGGNYQLKFSASSNKDNLHFGTIICAFGVRYKEYCSNIVRTLMINPGPKLQANYEFLLKIEEAILEKLRPGTRFCDVYKHALNLIEKERPDLVDKFTKNVGFVTGIEFREMSLTLAPKNTTVVRKGMVFCVAVGFSDLKAEVKSEDSAANIQALFIGDTVLVHDDKPAEIITPGKKLVKHVSFIIDEDKEEEEEEEEEVTQNDLLKDEQILGRGRRNNAILESKLRTEQSTEEKRKQHQKELALQLNEQARRRLSQKTGAVREEKSKKSTISYKSFNQMPNDREIKELKIFVDKKYETIVLPIFGIPVPFHISTIKNISQSVEGDYTYLRINFFHPGSALSKAESALYGSPEATFLKEITYRSTNTKEPGEISAPSSNLSAAFRLIKEVQKKFKTREAEEREMEGIVRQDNLILSNNKGNPKLKDLYIRPNLYSKRISGTLEAHVNGFRFTSIRGDKVDLLYNNIKHAFFQPCDGEMIILIHFTLRNAIMFGKKKHLDVQFYTEVGEITTDLGKHQHMHDRDDLAAEQAERELRNKLKTAFKSFCDKVEQMTKNDIDFDSPFRDLGFYGVPFRSSVILQPTSACLVNFTDWPPFVITLEDVELVHFERVQFHLKNFDMIFVFKDYTRKVVTVTAIPMEKLDSVKEWLNSCDIPYTEGVQSLNWNKIMKTINDDPDGFFDSGGWTFLDPQSDQEEAGEDEEDEEDERYSPTESSDEDSGSEDDFSESDAVSSESFSEEDLGTSEESGKDWSELEEEAREADREHEFEEARGPKASGSKGNDRRPPPPSSSKGNDRRPFHSSSKGGSSSKHRTPEKSKNGKRHRSESPRNSKQSSKKSKK